MNIIKSALGNYTPTGDVFDADIIIGNSFGTGDVNKSLASFVMYYREITEVPIVADRMLVEASPELTDYFLLGGVGDIAEGEISGLTGGGLQTIGVLKKAQEYIKKEKARTLLIGHASHIGRIAAQAEHIGMMPIVPSGMPGSFDKNSDQIFTKHPLLWIPREVLGSLMLRAEGKL